MIDVYKEINRLKKNGKSIKLNLLILEWQKVIIMLCSHDNKCSRLIIVKWLHASDLVAWQVQHSSASILPTLQTWAVWNHSGQGNLLRLISKYWFLIFSDQEVKSLVTRFYEHFSVIRPESHFIVVWNISIILIILFYILELPLILGFGQVAWQ